jgi:hypothetical protein
LWPGEEVGANCGADWAGVVKVRRKKRRRSVSGSGILKHAALGIVIALLLTAIVSSVVGRLALESAEGAELPQTPAERLGLAWKTLTDLATGMTEAVLERGGGVVFILFLGLLGGGIGILFYIRREGAFARRRRDDYLDAALARRKRTR